MTQVKAFTEADFVRVTQAAAATLPAGAPTLVGFLCESSTAGTLTVTDSPVTAGSRTLISAMALTAGYWYPFPAASKGAVTVTVGGTGVVTAFYNKD